MPPVEEPKPQEKTSIKDFQPKRNDALADIELSDAQVSEKKSLQAKADELDAQKKVVEEKPVESPQVKPVDKHEEDFVTPERETFDPSDPLALDDAAPVPKADETLVPKVDEIIAKKEGNSEMRSQIEEANKRTKAATERADSLTLANENLLKEVESARSGLTDAQNKLSHKDPSQHPDVKALVKPWDDELNSLIKEISLSGGAEVGSRLKADASSLVQQFRQLGEVGSEGYEERTQDLMGQIDASFPDDKREVIRILNRGAVVMDEATSLMESISQSGGEYEQGQALVVYEAMAKDYTELEKGYFNPTDEMRTSSPYSATVIHADYIQANDKLRDHSVQTKAFTRRAFLPLLPLSRNETRGMTDTEVAAYDQERTAKHRKDQLKIRDLAAPALFSHALLPIVQKQLDEALLQLKSIRDANPKPKGGDDDNPAVGDDGEVVKVENFDPGRSNLKFD